MKNHGVFEKPVEGQYNQSRVFPLVGLKPQAGNYQHTHKKRKIRVHHTCLFYFDYIFCRLKNSIDQVFHHQKGFIWGKRKGCNPVYADMASHMHTLACLPRWRGIYIIEWKRKLMEGDIRTTEPQSSSCRAFSSRVLMITQSRITSISPSSSH